MAAVKSMKCISRPPSRLPRTLVSLGRISSVISDCVLATVRAAGLVSMEFIGDLLHALTCRSDSPPPGRMKLAAAGVKERLFQFRQSPPNTQIHAAPDGRIFEQNGQNCRAERNSGTGPKEQFCPLWTGDGIGKPG